MSAPSPLVPLYLGGSPRELVRVRGIVHQLLGSGLFCFVEPWWVGAETTFGQARPLTREEQARQSSIRKTAISSAAIYWLLWPRDGGADELVELGYAQAYAEAVAETGLGELSIVVTGPGCSRAFHTASTTVWFREEVDALGLHEVLTTAKRLRAKASAPAGASS